ncbi:MAG: helix-turn-helix domain-containing protein, partial [Haloechinothrix sp.]
DAGSAVPRRQLGRELRRLRMDAGMTVEQAAQAIGRSSPTIWRMEKGGSMMRPGDVAGMCRVYGAEDRTTDALMALAAETKHPGWWRSYHGAIPKWFDTYIGLENAASHIRVYNDSEVTGLLQTRSYADAMFRAVRPMLTISEQEEAMAVRMRRQRLLTRSAPPAPKLEVVMGESVLLRRLPNPSDMAEQLRRLIEVSELPNVSVRVLPFDKSIDCVHDPRFNLLTFPRDRRGHPEPAVVYVECLAGALHLSKPVEIQAYDEMWEAISAAALSEFESLKLISMQIERYE